MQDRFIPFEATIKWIKKETRDTATYAVKINNRDMQKSYWFQPGQFNMLSLPGVGEAPISLSSAPVDYDLLHTVRVAGDVTTAFTQLRTGDVIGMRGPFGRGWPLEESCGRDLLLIAGGLGIAPLRSVIRQIMKAPLKDCSGGAPQQKHILLYGAKTPKDIVFRNEFPRYRGVFDVHLTVDKADPEEYWKGNVGIVTSLLDRVSFNPLFVSVFVCGPEIMMQTTVKELILRGVPGEAIFISLERNMNCGLGICGHCFFGPKFVCKDGPVFRFTDIETFMGIKEL